MKLKILFLSAFAAAVLSAAEIPIPNDNLLMSDVSFSLADSANGYVLKISSSSALSGAARIGRSQIKEIRFDKLPVEIPLNSKEYGTGALHLGIELDRVRKDGSIQQKEYFFSPREANRLPKELSVFDFEKYIAGVKNQKNRILISFELKEDSIVSIVLNDETGHRVRNLVTGQKYSAGHHTVEWDCRNEFRKEILPGKYNAIIQTHPGLKWDFLMRFADGDENVFFNWGPNHTVMTALAGNSKYVFAAAPMTEGGFSTVALTPDGKFVRGYAQSTTSAMTGVFICADDHYLYVVKDGSNCWGQLKKRQAITLDVFEIETGNFRLFNGRESAELFQSKLVGGAIANTVESSRELHKLASISLAGAAVIDGTLYCSVKEASCVLVVDPVKGIETGRIPLDTPGALAACGNVLYAVSGNKIMRLSSNGKSFESAFDIGFRPRGISIRSNMLAAVNPNDCCVKLFDMKGNLLKSIGIPGGSYCGKWQAERMIDPIGVLLASDGTLWTTEGRWNPKRIVRWNVEKGTILYEKYGSPRYGGSSAGFDPEDGSRWFADSTEWKVDLKAKTFRPVNVLVEGTSAPRSFRFVRYQGRTFVWGTGRTMRLFEYKDGTLKPQMFISIGFDQQRYPDPGFLKAVEPYLKDKNLKKELHSKLVLWLDRNGNGIPEPEEYEFSPVGSESASGEWGPLEDSISVYLPMKFADGYKLLKLSPDGFQKNGTIHYDLKKAIADAKPLTNMPTGINYRPNWCVTSDNGSNMTMVFSSPFMMGIDRNADVRWHFLNQWCGVHGSHNAPLLQPGVMQGVLFSLGNPPLKNGHYVSALLGNMGPVFFLTDDGVYIDHLFSDGRVSSALGPGLLGGEPFGGTFGFDRKSGKYLLQAGHGGYRIYEIKGLDQLKRSTQVLNITANNIQCALKMNPLNQNLTKRKTAVLKKSKSSDLRFMAVTAKWKHGDYDIVVKGVYNDKNLLLSYTVDDNSPWVNNGKSVPLLFKTGDAIDFRIAADPKIADAKRTVPGISDYRLLIAPSAEGDKAVLYRFKVPDADKKNANPVPFSSPWRTVTVEDVKILPLKIMKLPYPRGYTIAFAVPWTAFGLNGSKISGSSFAADFGVIFGDQTGSVNLARSCWNAAKTGLVNDVPGETVPPIDEYGKIEVK